MNLASIYFVGNGVDPLGLCCICESEPQKCFLEYLGALGDIGGTYHEDNTGARIGYGQHFHYTYFVTVKHKEGKSTRGCHIIQRVVAVYLLTNPGDAADFAELITSPTATVRVFDRGVAVYDPLDYDGSETYVNEEGYAEINDTVSLTFARATSFQNQVALFYFRASDYVKEAEGVNGEIGLLAYFSWHNSGKDPLKWIWAARSSDGRINEAGWGPKP